MRVLWGACAQPGSLFPAVPVVQELLRRGHQVTAIADDPTAEGTFRALGCKFVLAHRAAAVPSPARPLTRASKAAWWAALAPAVFTDVLEVLHEGSFDVVFSDALETGVAFGAEALGVPNCSYVHWGMDETGADVPFCFHLWDHESPIDQAFATWWNGLRALVGLGPDPRPTTEHRWYRTSPECTVLLGLPELVHPQGALPAGVVRVGPTMWDPPQHDPVPAWVDALGSEHPAVLGSVSTLGNTQDLQALVALAEASATLELDLVLTIPIQHELPALPGRVRTTSFLPHGTLLPRASVFINHAGKGAVTRAACSGTPALMLPTGRDQFQVAHGATAAGLGLTLQPEDRDVDHLTNALQRLLTDPAYLQTAQQLAQAAQGYDAASTAADQLESLTF